MATASTPGSAVSVTRHRLTVHEYYRMAEAGILRNDDRVELIDGEILDMSPIGSLHAAVVSRLARECIVALGEAAVVRVQDPLRIDEANEPEPDLVIARPQADFYAGGHPGPADVLLVIEVADTSLAHDIGTKAGIYATAGIGEYWVVDLLARCVIVMRNPASGRYETHIAHAAGEAIRLAAVPACSLNPLIALSPA